MPKRLCGVRRRSAPSLCAACCSSRGRLGLRRCCGMGAQICRELRVIEVFSRRDRVCAAKPHWCDYFDNLDDTTIESCCTGHAMNSFTKAAPSAGHFGALAQGFARERCPNYEFCCSEYQTSVGREGDVGTRHGKHLPNLTGRYTDSVTISTSLLGPPVTSPKLANMHRSIACLWPQAT